MSQPLWYTDLATRCRLVRVEAKLTQSEIARRIALSGPDPICRFERGKLKVIRIDLLDEYISLAIYVGRSREWLLLGIQSAGANGIAGAAPASRNDYFREEP